MTHYELHPLCKLFPRMSGAEFDALREDIRANGLRQTIVLYEGMILDGGNRYQACLEAGVKPRFSDFSDGNIVSFVLSLNLHRRHMTPGQQAAIVASAQDWARAQVRGGTGANQHANKEQTGNVTGLQTVADRAAQSGASDKTQRMADKVARADPELALEVGHGKVSLPVAVAQVDAKDPKRVNKPKKTSPPVATSPEKHDETPGPVERSAEGGSPAGDRNDYGASDDEMLTQFNDTLGENVRLLAIVEADDRLDAAMAQIKQMAGEIKQKDAEIFSLRGANRALQSETNEAIRLCKAAQRRADRLEKAAKEQAA